VGAALAGTAPAAAPEHGLRLSRVSMGPMPAFVAGSGAGEAAGPSPAEVSRLSGSFQATPR
jgi:hypothetical protein